MATRIPLANSTRFALVDDEVAEPLGRHKWMLNSWGCGYAFRQVRVSAGIWRLVLMHHVVAGAPPEGKEWDHVNGDGLDNRRGNLRLATRQQNLRNKKAYKRRVDSAARHSGFKGVSWRPDTKKWRVQIRVGGRQLSLGNFKSEVDAAMRYDQAARQHFGDFARLNFPREHEQPALRRAA